ncbi:MAG: aldo/keto reductase [Ilumatobacter sp.]|uniref:aldo/keto reductase n=1 Tax=Ilumatobacter sp. TaxID=1967498 RepID=UPI003C779B46
MSRRDDHRRLGRTALRVSPLCLGTMNFGPVASEETSHAILDRALDAGLNFVDTADQYGGSGAEGGGVGTTEEIIGRWMAEDASRRDRIVLATKVHEPMSDDPNDRGLSARHIRRACDASLRRLGTDHIDLYQMHHLDRSAHWDEIWQAMETLIGMGKISYVGSSNFPGWSIAQANEAARRRHTLGTVSEQSLYNLAERTVELEVLPAAMDYGVGVMAWSPLAGGLLGGVLNADTTGRRSSAAMLDRIEAHRPQLEQWESLCAELGRSPAIVALAWVAQQPALTSVIVGPRTVEQLDDAIASADLHLDDSTLRRIDEIWPGPGPAPEAYAW